MPESGYLDSGKYPTALVTGASSGIGLAIADLLQQSGIAVYGTSRFPERAKPLSSINWLPFDGSSEDALEKFRDEQHQLLSKVDILINNAGSSYFGKGTEVPDQIRQQQHFLLYEAPKRLCKWVIAGMHERRAGAIANISSLAALFTIPYMEDYSRSKAKLSAYTRQLIAENEEKGITIIDFQPGDYRTAFNSNIRRFGEPCERQQKAWQQVQKHMTHGPDPKRAAMDLCKALRSEKSGTIRSGTFFQSKLAPLGHRLLPQRFQDWAIRKYYHLP